MPRKAAHSRDEWVYINIPKELAEIIDNLIEAQSHGYRSRSEFVKDAVRRRLEELKPFSS